MDNKRFVVALVTIIGLAVYLGGVNYKYASEPIEEVYEVHTEQPPVQVISSVPVEPVQPVQQAQEEEPETTIYRVTAYCPCETCCGEWAKKRPIDENGEPIVVGSWGVELVDGFSCASPMAFGTQVELEGIGIVEVQDRTAKRIVEKYGENIIDIYMTDHEAAEKFEVQYIKGVIK